MAFTQRQPTQSARMQQQQQQSQRLMATWLLVAGLMVAVAAQSAEAAPALTMDRPHRNDVSSVADAIRYLQELDHYYGQISRPRFGKRSNNPAIALYLQEAAERRHKAAVQAQAAEPPVSASGEEDLLLMRLLNERR